MALRQELLQASSEEDCEAFLKLYERHGNKSDEFDLAEIIPTFDRPHLVELWDNLQMRCTATLLSFHGDTEEQQQMQELQHALSVLQAIVTVAMVTIECQDPVIPPSLLETAVILHGILLSLPERGAKVCAAIAKLCIAWWNQELDGRQELCFNTLMYIIEKALKHGATNTDVKKMWSLRECLQVVDLSKDASSPLKASLAQAYMSPLVLKLDEGRRFLAFVFGLDLSYVDTIHQAIKVQIPSCKTSSLEAYGEIYFKAWRDSSGPIREKLELKCIQDLMYHAVHAMRGSTHSLDVSLRKVLGHIHHQKKQRGVDEMLLRLYEPILWRALKVANGQVRANAAALLIDVFPLHQPDATMEENDALMQKQFDILQGLLGDPCPTVRVTAIQGVCRICNVFWELIPVGTITGFLNKLGQELAWDGTSPDVRVAVIKGLIHLMGNHLSHPVLKVLLPSIGSLLHDNAEKVRVCFLDMLKQVKGLRAIKFWTIAPVEHLLARLEVDTPSICRRIVSLLHNSYMPTEKPGDVQLARCISLLQTNPAAARKFYQYAHGFMSIGTTSRFILLLCRCVLQCVRRNQQSNGHHSDSEEEEDKENVSEVEGEELSAEDTDLMAGLLETIAILWEGIAPALNKPANAEMKNHMKKWFQRALPEFFRNFTDPRICSCLILLAGHLPPNTIPTFSRSALAKLRGMTAENTAEQYGPLVESLCKWNKVGDITELLSDWLSAVLVAKETPDPNNSKSRRSRAVTFDDPAVPQPELALDILRYMTKHAMCRSLILECAQKDLREVADVLRNVTTLIERRFTSAESANIDGPSDQFLQNAFEMYCRLEILLHNSENKDDNAITTMERLLSWADTELVPALHKKQPKRRLLNQTERTLLAGPGDSATFNQTTMMSTTLLAPKRTASDSQSPALVELAASVIQSMLTVSSNMLLVGVGDRELASHLADFARIILKAEEASSTRFLPLISTLMYQITEFTLSLERGEQNADEGVGTEDDVVPDMLHKVTHMIATLVKAKREQAERILPTIRPAMSEVLQSYFRHHALHHEGRPKDVMATIVSAVVAEVSNSIRKDNHFHRCEALSDLPLLSNFLLSILNKRANMTSLFVEELHRCIKSGSVESLEECSACLHVVYTLSKGRHNVGELKDCVLTLQARIEGIQLPEDIMDESPIRFLHQSSKETIKESMNQLGMVA